MHLPHGEYSVHLSCQDSNTKYEPQHLSLSLPVPLDTGYVLGLETQPTWGLSARFQSRAILASWTLSDVAVYRHANPPVIQLPTQSVCPDVPKGHSAPMSKVSWPSSPSKLSFPRLPFSGKGTMVTAVVQNKKLKVILHL